LREKVTAEEFGQILWLFCKDSAKTLCKEIKQKAESRGYHFDERKQFDLARQSLIVTLWIISKTLPEEKRSLDTLHDIYFAGQQNLGETEQEKHEILALAQDELHDRYQRYYQAWPESPGDLFTFCSKISQCILKPENPDGWFLDAFLVVDLLPMIVAMLEAVSDFRTQYEIGREEKP